MIRIPVLLYILLSLYTGACISPQATLQKTSHTELKPPKPIDVIEIVHQHIPHVGADDLHIFVSFLVDETGRVVNPVVTQDADEITKRQAIKALKYIRFEPGYLGTEPVNVEMTLPVSFRGEKSPPDLSTFLDQVPILLGSMEHLVEEIQYPERARRANLEGRVTVAFMIDKDGYVRFPTVTQSLGAGCDEEVLRTVQQIRFAPGQLRGEPVNVVTSLTFVFMLT